VRWVHILPFVPPPGQPLPVPPPLSTIPTYRRF
jgi:hypothetical protein